MTLMLKNGKRLLIDDEDMDRVNAHKWCLSGNGHVMRYAGKRAVYIHHFLIGQPFPPYQVDHINRNPLDNRKCNLRIVHRSINTINRGLRRDNTSGVTGVYRHRLKWRAIRADGTFRGGFNTLGEAAIWRAA